MEKEIKDKGFNVEELKTFKEKVLSKYPKKVARKREKSIVVNDPDAIPEIQSNVRTVPGSITQRGCTYAGCKGGSIRSETRDIINITHGTNRLRFLLLVDPVVTKPNRKQKHLKTSSHTVSRPICRIRTSYSVVRKN